MSHTPSSLPDFTRWPSFPFEGDFRVRPFQDPVAVEPPRKGEDATDCAACSAPDEAYIWVSERWRVRAMDRPSGLPMVLILESRSHLDLGDLPNLLAAELGVMTVRLERAVRTLDGVARVHVNRWGDGSAHLHLWFLARPYGRLQLRGTFLSLWDDILPPIEEAQWRENLALVAAWLGEFGGRPLAEPPRFQWQTPLSLSEPIAVETGGVEPDREEASSVALAEAAPEGSSQGPSEDSTEDPQDQTRPVPASAADGSDARGDDADGPVPDVAEMPASERPAADRDQPTRTAAV